MIRKLLLMTAALGTLVTAAFAFRKYPRVTRSARETTPTRTLPYYPDALLEMGEQAEQEGEAAPISEEGVAEKHEEVENFPEEVAIFPEGSIEK
jgi:hypothetical protein